MNNLNINERDNSINKSGKKSRQKGKVPGILYGKKLGSFMFEVGELELSKEVSQVGEHGVLSFNIGNEEKNALIKEVQRDPVTHKIVHIDLGEIENTGNIETDVQIQYVGEGKLASNGTVLQKEKDSVKVSCKVEDLPKNIKIDVSNGMAGSVFRYADLEVGEEISIIDNIDAVIASISNEKKIVSAIAEEEEKSQIDEK